LIKVILIVIRINLFFLQLYFLLLAGVGTSHAAQNKDVSKNEFQSIIEKTDRPKYKVFESGITFIQEIVVQVEEELLNSDEHADKKGANSLVNKEGLQPWYVAFSFQTTSTKSIANLKNFKQVRRYANSIYILHSVLRI
jgi:hypothetical protein